MPEQTVAELLVHAPAADVVGVVADVGAYPQWAGGVRAAEVLAVDERGRPDRARFTVSSFALRDIYVLRYGWDVDDGGSGAVSWTLESSDALSAMDGGYTFTPEGHGTRVTYRLSVELSIPLPAPLRRRAEKTITSGALAGLRRRAEDVATRA